MNKERLIKREWLLNVLPKNLTLIAADNIGISIIESSNAIMFPELEFDESDWPKRSIANRHWVQI